MRREVCCIEATGLDGRRRGDAQMGSRRFQIVDVAAREDQMRPCARHLLGERAPDRRGGAEENPGLDLWR